MHSASQNSNGNANPQLETYCHISTITPSDYALDGTVEAMERLMDWARSLPERAFPMGKRLAGLPSWISAPSLEMICHHLDDPTDREVALFHLRTIRVARVQLDNLTEGKPLSISCPEMTAHQPGQPVTTWLSDPRGMACTLRLAYGELLEAAARLQAIGICEQGEVPTVSNKKGRGEMSRLMFDSYHAAVWTSAHAEYLMNLEELLSTMPEGTSALTSNLRNHHQYWCRGQFLLYQIYAQY